MRDLVLFASGIELYLAKTANDGGCRRPGKKCGGKFCDKSDRWCCEWVFDWRRRLRRRRVELCSPSEIADARWGVEINFVIPAFLSTKYARGRKLQIYRRLSNVAYTRNQWKIYPAFARCRTFLSHLTSQYVTIINDSRYKAEKRRSCDSATNTA